MNNYENKTSEQLADELARYMVAELRAPVELSEALISKLFKEVQQEERAKSTSGIKAV